MFHTYLWAPCWQQERKSIRIISEFGGWSFAIYARICAHRQRVENMSKHVTTTKTTRVAGTRWIDQKSLLLICPQFGCSIKNHPWHMVTHTRFSFLSRRSGFFNNLSKVDIKTLHQQPILRQSVANKIYVALCYSTLD